MTKEYKSYDTDDTYEIRYARLSKDAEVRDGEYGQMVKLSFASTSRRTKQDGTPKYETLWITANVANHRADLAAFLEKGDVLGVRGKPVLRRYGDDNDKLSYELENADLSLSIDLIMALKDRGWDPKAKAEGKGKAPAPSKKPPPKRAGKPVKVVDVDDEDDLDEDE